MRGLDWVVLIAAAMTIILAEKAIIRIGWIIIFIILAYSWFRDSGKGRAKGKDDKKSEGQMPGGK